MKIRLVENKAFAFWGIVFFAVELALGLAAVPAWVNLALLFIGLNNALWYLVFKLFVHTATHSVDKVVEVAQLAIYQTTRAEYRALISSGDIVALSDGTIQLPDGSRGKVELIG